MWQNEFLLDPKFSLHETRQECQDQATIYADGRPQDRGDEFKRGMVPVGVIDLSDIPALVEQVAKALAYHDWEYHEGSGLPAPIDGYLPEAHAILSSLGLIPARRRKK